MSSVCAVDVGLGELGGPRRTGPPPSFLMHFGKWSTLRSVSRASDLERMLRGATLRVTRPRPAVLAAVHAHRHSDTDSIIGAVRGELPAVSHQAVDDIHRAETAAGLVRRTRPSGTVARCESRVGDTTTSTAGRAAPLPTSTAPSAQSRA